MNIQNIHVRLKMYQVAVVTMLKIRENRFLNYNLELFLLVFIATFSEKLPLHRKDS